MLPFQDDVSAVPNGKKTPFGFDGMADADVENRLKV